MKQTNPLHEFHPVVRSWFERTFGAPTPPQTLGWPVIASGRNTLLLAPTGSGKTFAAFLWALNHLVEQKLREDLSPGVRIVYVSPLKALNNDIERNLRAPLAGFAEAAHETGLALPQIRAQVRTGDTPQAERAGMVRRPPDILITTPESLYLMLTSKEARRIFTTAQYVIVDEIHAIAGNKRGVHLSLTLERLQRVAEQEMIRIGLSATQRPLERIASYLGGASFDGRVHTPRPVTVVDAGRRKDVDLLIECPVPDFGLLPQEGVWPEVFSALLRLILRHRTTLVFVNNRRQAERVAAQITRMLGDDSAPGEMNMYAVPVPTGPGHASTRNAERSPPFEVKAYHGSMSRASRERMESDLKQGKLRALVATSALELGIDIGSIDLVVQVQSPHGIARGLQRVGRSGHLVSATSKGRILPTHREDLAEAAVIARAMADHDIEETAVPANCLDILAQQIVAMVAVEDWTTDDLFALVRRSYCYRSLPRKMFDGVVAMLAGRFASESFRELRARISWDRVNNLLRAMPGSRRIAVVGGGAITDKGAFAVVLEDGKTRVGEVDEEFVFETRPGDTFILGTSVWRVSAIDANRVTVLPAPGAPARMPFWRGEGIGRTTSLGAAVGAFRRELAARLNSPDTLAWLQHEFPADSRSAWNLLEYFRNQQQTAGVVPHDRLVLVESFRDDIGDPRIIVHWAGGRRVNSILGLVLARLLYERTGVTPQMFANDNGVLLRCSDMDSVPLDLFDGLSPEAAEKTVLEEVLGSPLFGGQFRQNAARALLMPRAFPGRRTPLWLQRLRAKDLLELARRHDDFPIVIETLREVFTDVLDLDAFRALLTGIRGGGIGVATVRTEVPSPFSASLLFDFIAVYMYEWDQPRADRLSRYAAINRELLGEVMDLEGVAAMLRPESVAEVEAQLQHTAEGSRARSPEELMELLLALGDLTEDEVLQRCDGDGAAMVRTLEMDGRAARVHFHDGDRWIAAEEAGLYTALSIPPNTVHVLRRYIRNHGPASSRELARRYNLPEDAVGEAVSALPPESGVLRGRFLPPSHPGADSLQWAARSTLERIHRRTIHILRHEITPCPLDAYTRYLQRWQYLLPSARLRGEDGVRACLARLQGLPLPAEIWEREILGKRIESYDPGQIEKVTAGGGLVWTGSGPSRLMVFARGTGGVFLSAPEQETSGTPGPSARRVLEYLRSNGASFFSDIRNGTGLSLPALNAAIGALVWSGLITNDTFGEMTGVRRAARNDAEIPPERIEILAPRRGPESGRIIQRIRRAIRDVPGWTGRWSVVRVPAVLGPNLAPEEQAAAFAVQLLERYGVVAREIVRRENLPSWPAVASELAAMELRGEIRRGYFVEGLSGMQFALPEAVDLLRESRSRPADGDRILLAVNACDPANPFGPGLEIPVPPGVAPVRLTRTAGNTVAFREGKPVLLIESWGSRWWTLPECGDGDVSEAARWLREAALLPARLRPYRRVVIETINGERAAASPFMHSLRHDGFEHGAGQTLVWFP